MHVYELAMPKEHLTVFIVLGAYLSNSPSLPVKRLHYIVT